jgi:TRAP-type C4-dicarboxylate transport system substrate-binding protein
MPTLAGTLALVRAPSHEEDAMRRSRLITVTVLAAALVPALAAAQATLPPGPKLNLQVVAHPIPTHPQWTQIDIPYYKEIIPKRSSGRIEIKGATWPEMNIGGPEIIRMTRQGQIEIGGAPLTYMAGDIPILDAADLAGLNPTVEQTRKVVNALAPIVNKEIERFGVKMIATYPYPAQVFFCR